MCQVPERGAVMSPLLSGHCCMDLSYLFLSVLPFVLFLWLAIKPFLYSWHLGVASCGLFCDTDFAHGSPLHTLSDVCSTESVPTGALREEQALWKRALAGMLKGCRPSSVWSLAGIFSFDYTVLFLYRFTIPWEYSLLGAQPWFGSVAFLSWNQCCCPVSGYLCGTGKEK